MKQQNKLQKQKQLKKAVIIAGIFLSIICSFSVYGNSVSEPKTEKKAVTSVEEEDEIKTIVETPPSYPGGINALTDFLQKQLKYPPKALKKKIEGTVYVRFIVNRDGDVVEVEVVRGVNEDLDKEAVRVVKMMPKWSPGTQKGVPVRARYTLPVKFKLK